MSDSIDLTGKLLIAMPGLIDSQFDRSVVYICAHSGDGAMGVIVNKPSEGVLLGDLVEQLDLGDGTGNGKAVRDMIVHFGGPVEHGRGFVLHSADYVSSISTLQVDAQFGMTATLDVLEELAEGHGPARAIMALGYAGWGPGQLENEILANGWLTCDATPDLVFDANDAGKWAAALKGLGVDPLMLSAEAGRA